MKQAVALVHDEDLRRSIIANAKEYVDTNFNEKDEYEGYSKLATGMCTYCTAKKEKASYDADEVMERRNRVRFQFEVEQQNADAGAEESADLESGCAETQDATEEAQSSENHSVMSEEEKNQLVENETPHKELEGDGNTSKSAPYTKKPLNYVICKVIPSDDEKETPESSHIPAHPDSMSDGKKDGKQPATAKGGEDHARNKIENVEQPSTPRTDTAVATTPSSKSPRVVATKTDARKRTTDTTLGANSTKNSPPTAAGKGGGASGKNGHKQLAVPTGSDGAKKTTTTTSKKAPLNSTNSVDKPMLKEPLAHRSATRTISDTGVGTRPTSRLQKTKK